MITRLEVDGFKSLRDFAIDFEPFTVLIGPNSAGKSNVLDALALLSRLASQPIADAFKAGRGKSIDQFTRRGGEASQRIRFAVELFTGGGHLPDDRYGGSTFQSRFRYELTITRKPLRAGVERLVAEDERLLALHRDKDSWIESHPKLAGFAGYGRAGDDYDFIAQNNGTEQQIDAGQQDDPLGARRLTALARSLSARIYPARSTFMFAQVLRLDPEGSRYASERIGSPTLSPDASNLPTVLAGLSPEVLGEIRADLVSLVPGISSFGVHVEGDDFHIDFELSGGERLPGRLISAGTMRVLAQLTSLRTNSHTLCIEEPENGIYPGRLLSLLALLREATRAHVADVNTLLRVEKENPEVLASWAYLLPTQVILTTHSPIVLGALRDEPQHLRFVDMVRRDGERVSRVRSVGSADRRTMISPDEIDALLRTSASEDMT